VTATTATSTTSVIALDEDPEPPLDVAADAAEDPLAGDEIDGNFATFAGDARAEGEDAYGAMSATLEVGDELSSVTAAITAIV
jgi:hypothetical protein